MAGVQLEQLNYRQSQGSTTNLGLFFGPLVTTLRSMERLPKPYHLAV